MNGQRIMGIVLLIAGVALLVIGLNASHSVVERMSQTFMGRFTETTTWYIVGGSVAGLLGLFLLIFGGGRR